ncbi:MAG: hypothetical protein WCH46_06105 [bacterium]
MRHIHIFFISGFLLALGILQPQQTLAQKKWPGVVLFSIERNSISREFIIDPVVRIDEKGPSYPVPTPPEAFDGPDAEKVIKGYFDRFCKEEYKKGRVLDLYVGGNKTGVVKVGNIDTLNSCSSVISEVKLAYDDSMKFLMKLHGLVISHAQPLRPIPEFKIDSVLEIGVLKYGKDEFTNRGVPKNIVDRAYIFEIRATDLDGDGKPEYLVTYYIMGDEVKRGEFEGEIQYSLTVILRPDGNGFKSLFTHYPDPGISLETHYYKIVDVLDIAGDGNCDVVIQRRNVSSWDYILLQYNGKIYEEVYEGSGGGC